MQSWLAPREIANKHPEGIPVRFWEQCLKRNSGLCFIHPQTNRKQVGSLEWTMDDFGPQWKGTFVINGIRTPVAYEEIHDRMQVCLKENATTWPPGIRVWCREKVGTLIYIFKPYQLRWERSVSNIWFDGDTDSTTVFDAEIKPLHEYNCFDDIPSNLKMNSRPLTVPLGDTKSNAFHDSIQHYMRPMAQIEVYWIDYCVWKPTVVTESKAPCTILAMADKTDGESLDLSDPTVRARVRMNRHEQLRYIQESKSGNKQCGCVSTEWWKRFLSYVMAKDTEPLQPEPGVPAPSTQGQEVDVQVINWYGGTVAVTRTKPPCPLREKQFEIVQQHIHSYKSETDKTFVISGVWWDQYMEYLSSGDTKITTMPPLPEFAAGMEQKIVGEPLWNYMYDWYGNDNPKTGMLFDEWLPQIMNLKDGIKSQSTDSNDTKHAGATSATSATTATQKTTDVTSKQNDNYPIWNEENPFLTVWVLGLESSMTKSVCCNPHATLAELLPKNDNDSLRARLWIPRQATRSELSAAEATLKSHWRPLAMDCRVFVPLINLEHDPWRPTNVLLEWYNSVTKSWPWGNLD